MANEKMRRCPGQVLEYSAELGEKLCELISEGDMAKAAARKLGIAPGAVFRWCVDRPDFFELHNLALEHRTKIWAEEMVVIADDPFLNLREKKLRIDMRKRGIMLFNARIRGGKKAKANRQPEFAQMTKEEQEREMQSFLVEYRDALARYKRERDAAKAPDPEQGENDVLSE